LEEGLMEKEKYKKLNLGCGVNLMEGYLNIDKFGKPDLVHDLNVFPWPFDDDSVEEVNAKHVLEHLGETIEQRFGIIKELYRICKNGAMIHIEVPHPRHEDFISDPTHVWPIMPGQFELLSKKKNEEWEKEGFSNSQLAKFLDVDFEIKAINLAIMKDNLPNGDENSYQMEAIKHNNIIKEIHMDVEVVK
jgi:hypothetical protein